MRFIERFQSVNARPLKLRANQSLDQILAKSIDAFRQDDAGVMALQICELGGNAAVDYGQMSILRWLEAGAKASYGTETEPCNYSQKFPQASVLVKHYFLGNTVVEAYLKSVQWPSQGVFIGDPLARPFGTVATLTNGNLNITTTSLDPGVTYALYSAPASAGPFTQIATVSVSKYQFATINVAGMSAPFYKLESTTAPADITPPSAPTRDDRQ